MSFLALLTIVLGPVQEEEITVKEAMDRVSKADGVEIRAGSQHLKLNWKVKPPAGKKELFRQLRGGGYAAVRFGDGYVVLPASTATKRALVPYTDPEKLPKEDEFCRLVLNLERLSPRVAHASLINYVTHPQSVFPVEQSQQIIIHDYASNLRELAKLVRMMDKQALRKPEGEYQVRFTLIKAGGEAGKSPGEIPDNLKTYGDALRRLAPYPRYDRLDTASIRFHLERKGGVSVALSGDEDFRVEFTPETSGNSVVLSEVSLQFLHDRRIGGELLRSSITLRDGAHGIVGTTRVKRLGWPVILVAELSSVGGEPKKGTFDETKFRSRRTKENEDGDMWLLDPKEFDWLRKNYGKLAAGLTLREEKHGLRITGVTPGTFWSARHFRSGDLIQSINGMALGGVRTFHMTLTSDDIKTADRLTFSLDRNGRGFSITLQKARTDD